MAEHTKTTREKKKEKINKLSSFWNADVLIWLINKKLKRHAHPSMNLTKHKK